MAVKECGHCGSNKLRMIQSYTRKGDGVKVRRYICGSCGEVTSSAKRLRDAAFGTPAKMVGE